MAALSLKENSSQKLALLGGFWKRGEIAFISLAVTVPFKADPFSEILFNRSWPYLSQHHLGQSTFSRLSVCVCLFEGGITALNHSQTHTVSVGV